jgi:hypothetical protein
MGKRALQSVEPSAGSIPLKLNPIKNRVLSSFRLFFLESKAFFTGKKL